MPYVRETSIEYVVPSDAETAEARESSRALALLLGGRGPLSVQIAGGGEDRSPVLTLPESAARLLLDILGQMAEGRAVTVLPLRAELTTQQAAEVLGVSRPYLVRLLEAGQIPHRKVGAHRRVLLADVVQYKGCVDAARAKSLDELVALGQELDLGY